MPWARECAGPKADAAVPGVRRGETDGSGGDFRLDLLPWHGLILAVVLGLLSVRLCVPSLAGLGLLCLFWKYMGGRMRVLPFFLLLFAMGWGYATLRMPDPPGPLPDSVHPGEKGQVRGIVEEVRGRVDQRLWVILREAVSVAGDGTEVPLPGHTVLSWHHPTQSPLPGTQLTLRSSVRRFVDFGNPGASAYAFYWRVQGVHQSLYLDGDKHLEVGPEPDAPLARFRRGVQDAVTRGAGTTPGGAVLTAMLIGDRYFVEPETQVLMRDAGLAHTLAQSGLHVGFVASLGYVLAWLVGLIRPGVYLRLPRPKLAVLLSAPLIAGFVWLGQGSPSLLRAALMFALWGGLLLWGRSQVLLDGLFGALAIILVFNPMAVFDLRLQYSAVAVGGIAMVSPFMARMLGGGRGIFARVWRGAAALLAMSVGANLGVLGLTAWYFGVVAPNLLTNLFWLPLLGFAVMPLGLLGMGCSLVPGLSGVSGWLLGAGAWVLDKMLFVPAAMGEWGVLPVVQVLRPLWPELLGGLCLLACLVYGLRTRRTSWAAVFVGLVFMAVPHVTVMAQDVRDRVTLAMVDVGQGQCLVVTAPGGGRLVVDGSGVRSRTFDTGRAVVAPYLTLGRAPRLQGALLTHPHLDHYKGLVHLVDHFQLGSFFYSGDWPGEPYRERFETGLAEQGLQAEAVAAGDALDLGEGLVAVVIHPQPGVRCKQTNDRSVVLRLDWRGRPLALLAGDAEAEAMAALLESGAALNVPVLVLPHHGGYATGAEVFHDAVRPDVALASYSLYNRYGLPNSEVADSLARIDARAYGTGVHGLVRVVWDDPNAPPVVGTFRCRPPEL